MSEIGPKESICYSARDYVAVNTRGAVEYFAALLSFRIERCICLGGLPLRAHPAVEVRWRVHICPQEHFCVLRAAVLRALAEKKPRLMRIDPHAVGVIWN